MPESNVTLYAIWVDSEGNIIPSPGTGESNVPLQISLSMAILSLLAAGIAVMKQQKRRQVNAD